MKSLLAILLLVPISAAADERLHRGRNHYEDWYFVVVDEHQLNVTDRAELKRFAQDVTALPGIKLIPGEFMGAPQGIRVAGSEEAVLQLLADPRVKWVEEVGPFVRQVEPVPGRFIVEIVAPSAETRLTDDQVTAVASALLREYGGHLLNPLALVFTGFAADQLTDEQARAMSQDPRVLRVYQDGHLPAYNDELKVLPAGAYNPDSG
jgi:hypothetical protein